MEMASSPQPETTPTERKVKVCRDVECEERYKQLPQEAQRAFLEFSYCPFCSNELVILCSSCREALADKEYKYCPWCGCQFQK